MTEYCQVCSSEIDKEHAKPKCATCKKPMHNRCARHCGAMVLEHEKGAASTSNKRAEPVRVACATVFCDAHIVRQPICVYQQDTDLCDSDDELQHAQGVPLCNEHIGACVYCRFAVCNEHQEPDYDQRHVTYKMHECAQCRRVCCDKHALFCAYTCDVECIVCGGMKATDVDVQWADVYGSDYLCKRHRAIRQMEAMVKDEDRPDSPEGEPMSRASRRQWANDKNDERIKYKYQYE